MAKAITNLQLHLPKVLVKQIGPQLRGGGAWKQFFPLKFSELLLILLNFAPLPLKYFCPTMVCFLVAALHQMHPYPQFPFTQDQTKFDNVVAYWDNTTAAEVKVELLNPPTENKHETLKKALLSAFGKSQTQKGADTQHLRIGC